MSAIVVCSGKGSPGATFVAANLAAAMARAGDEILLLDLDPSGGDLCCYLGLNPRLGLYPLLRMERSISEMTRLLGEAEERSGFLVVCGFPEPSELASADVLAEALSAALGSGRTVVADIGRVSEANASVAAKADLVELVVRADLVSVLGAERAMRQLEAGGTRRERIAAVVSCHERRRPADLVEVGDALGLPLLGAVPLDRRAARNALLAQAPAGGRTLRRAFDALSATAGRILAEADREAEAVAPELAKVWA